MKKMITSLAFAAIATFAAGVVNAQTGINANNVVENGNSISGLIGGLGNKIKIANLNITADVSYTEEYECEKWTGPTWNRKQHLRTVDNHQVYVNLSAVLTNKNNSNGNTNGNVNFLISGLNASGELAIGDACPQEESGWTIISITSSATLSNGTLKMYNNGNQIPVYYYVAPTL